MKPRGTRPEGELAEQDQLGGRSIARMEGERIENQRKDRRGCFGCGSWCHRVRECPQEQRREPDDRISDVVTSTGMDAMRPIDPSAREDSMSSDEWYEGIAVPETPPWMLSKTTGSGCARDEARGGSPDSATSM